MKSRISVGLAMMLAALVLSFVPAAVVGTQPARALSTCDWAQFVADVTVPDGTVFAPGTAFTKTWRLKNIGSCTWTTSYALVFDTGERMGGPTSVNLPSSVFPGQTVDISIGLTAPSVAGTYRGFWMFQNASGGRFGIGANGSQSWWVAINVSGSASAGVAYDFATNYCSASWYSLQGSLPCPGTDGDSRGFVLKVSNPQLENGSYDTGNGLITNPQNTFNGDIHGVFPAFHVQSGDRFQSIINCAYGATSCAVNFRLDYQIGSGPINTFWSVFETYDGLYSRADVDLSALAGQDVKFILTVLANGSATGDRALWSNPAIVRAGGGPFPPTPPAPLPLPEPTTSCDRAQFIADVTVPDGTVFAPGTSFSKTWRLKNVGTCTWTTSYLLVFDSGNQMGGPNSVNLPNSVLPGQTVDLTLNLTAPNSGGSYRGYWRFQNASGVRFGLGADGTRSWWVDIRVSGAPFPQPSSCDRAQFITDVTVPDGTPFSPGTSFSKTWRMKNVGSCTWTTSYLLVFDSGNQMGGPNSVNLPSTVFPGQTVDLTLNLTAPSAGGSYRGFWKFQNASGVRFGIGADGNQAWWVDILVSGSPAITYTISGNAGVASATLSYTGGSVMADGSGNYSITVPSGWSGMVTPSKTGYTFSPTNRTYTNVVANATGQNYTATAAITYTISGNAGVAGATLSYTGGSVMADGSGNYSITVPSGWSGMVTPSKTGYTFSPTNRTYTNVVANATGQNYTATAAITYTISGNAGIAGATLNYTGGPVMADGSGNYSITVPSGWSGTVTPSLTGYTFSPTNRNYTSVVANTIGQNYTATPVTTFNFDFGTADPRWVAPGYLSVTHTTLYSPSVGYGWTDITDLESWDRGAPAADLLRRDFVQSSSRRTFRTDLPNGTYSVTVIMGDKNVGHDHMVVKANGTTVLSDVNTDSGSSATWAEHTFTVAVSSGSLLLEFSDAGGTDPNWVVNAVTIGP